MPNKVKRGLGLLVLSVLIALVGGVLTGIGNASSNGDLASISNAAWTLLILVAIGLFVWGLVQIAWGLLRD